MYEFKTGKKPIRIKAGETFSVKITPPEVNCSCGKPWEELRLVSYAHNGKPKCYVYCPRCDKKGPPEDNTALATLAWGGMISREQKGDSGVRDV